MMIVRQGMDPACKATNSDSHPMNSYKSKEAALCVVKQVLDEIGACDGKIAPEVANAYLDFARIAMQDSTLPT